MGKAISVVKALPQSLSGRPVRATRRVICKFPSLKLGRTVFVTSLLARDLLYLLEFDPEIVAYTEEAPRIAYPDDGKHCEYAFNFLIERQNRKQLAKLLPSIDDEQAQLHRRLRAVCEDAGYELVIFTESIIRVQPRLNNIKLLTRYARLRIAPPHHYACHRFFTHNSSVVLGELMEFFVTEGLERQSVLAMLYHGLLASDLMTPLTLQSAISLRKDAAREVA